jgi:uncharacterized SAM-binding protein YcdF (DUF218 family)
MEWSLFAMSVDMSSRAQRRNPGALDWRAALAVTGLVAFLGFLGTGALLSAPASVPRRVDAVVVLGGDAGAGGIGVRYAYARDLVLAGYSKRLILIHPGTLAIENAQARVPGMEVMDAPLVRSSWDEAKAIRARMQAEGLRSVMVVSDPPHMLRLRYTWGSIFRGTDLDYTLIATNPPWWPDWRWWRNPGSVYSVGSEVVKLGYYVVKYRFGF